MNLDVKYLHRAKRDRIIRMHRDGFLLWRIARDAAVPIDVVREVLVAAGESPQMLRLNREVRT